MQFSFVNKFKWLSNVHLFSQSHFLSNNGYATFNEILSPADCDALNKEASNIISKFKQEQFPTHSYSLNDYAKLDSFYCSSISKISPFLSADAFENNKLKPNYKEYIESIGHGTFIISLT